MRLNKDSPIPLYHQLKDALIEMIEQQYQPGDLLPTEPEIEKMFSVSRMTVRLAMNLLVEEGLVVKQRGRGTFVQTSKITHDLKSITSWTQEMKARGFMPKTVDMNMAKINPPKKIAVLLNLNPEDSVIRIKRLRYANNEPMCIMINYLSEKYVKGLIEDGLTRESLYEQLALEYEVHILNANDTVEAREASEHEAELLNIPDWSPVLFVTRVSYMDEGVPLEVVHLTSRADRYQYQIKLSATDNHHM